MLAGYEVDLLPQSLNVDEPPSQMGMGLFMPANADLRTGLANGEGFEARVTLNTNFPGIPSGGKGAGGSGRGTGSGAGAFSFGGASSGVSSAPTLEAVSVTIPFPAGVRNVADFKASRGDVMFDARSKTVEWKIPTKDGYTVNGTATLTGMVMGAVDAVAGAAQDLEGDKENDGETLDGKSRSVAGYYGDADYSGQDSLVDGNAGSGSRARASKSALMPQSLAVSFTVKGWLPSGIKVDSLVVDVKKSKGLGEGVRPFKGVKYVCVSKKGVERRAS